MNIREISKPVTAKSLNESLAKKFGQRVDLEKFTLEQLQDARNKIRTKVFQVETNESFDSVVKNESYQKSKLFLDVLNAAISEREVVEAAKPDYIDIDGDGDKEEPMKKAAKDAKKKKVNELGVTDRQTGQTTTLPSGNVQGDSIEDLLQQAKELALQSGDPNGQQRAREIEQIIRSMQKVQPMRTRTGESVIIEGAEDEAELVMASKDMVDRLTGWMEDTAEMQSESMLELADAIRDEMGSAKSEEYVSTVKPALASLYAAMEQTRVTLTQGVGMLTGEGEGPADMMGADDGLGDMDMDMEPPVDAETPLEEPAGDDFEVAAPAAGGDEEAGRARRESKQINKKKIAEQSRRLANTFSKKK